MARARQIKSATPKVWRLRLDRWPSACYRSDTVPAWPVGETREVAPEVAAYLLSTFEGHFSEV